MKVKGEQTRKVLVVVLRGQSKYENCIRIGKEHTQRGATLLLCAMYAFIC